MCVDDGLWAISYVCGCVSGGVYILPKHDRNAYLTN